MPNTAFSDDFWDDLFSFLEEGRIIPVIGPGAITKGPENSPLYPWLAGRLAEKLQIKFEPGPSGNASPVAPNLNEVASRHLLAGGAPNLLYTRLSSILRNELPEPGETLLQLAKIRAFKLFVTAGFDPLLEHAINRVRFGSDSPPPGAPATGVAAFWPNAGNKDTPAPLSDLSAPLVYHILGKVSPSPEFVVWEADALEFICGLHKHMPEMKNLAHDLKDHALLLIGLGFTDWLSRFFLRVTRQSPLSEPVSQMQVLADHPGHALADSLIVFFESTRSNVRAVPCDPVAFVAELFRRWEAGPGAKGGSFGGASQVAALLPREMPDGAIFLSYAREDGAAVHVLKERLEAAGCLVWFDRERNEGGDDFARKMERAVKEQASVFISVVSANTEGKGMAWCHRERRWAAERSEFFTEGEVFYVPTTVDETPPPYGREPTAFRSAHCEPSPAGDATDAFCRRIRDLQIHNSRLMGISSPGSLAAEPSTLATG